jgi:hypothetical protein
MNEILKPTRLAQLLLVLLLTASVCHFSACRPPAPDGEEINADSVKNHILPIEKAIQYTASFRASIDTFNKTAPHFADSMHFGHAEAFNKDVIRELLRQSDSLGKAAGIRIYYGRDNAGSIRMILVPYDSAGNDIITHIINVSGKPANGAHVEALTVSGGQTLEDGIRCPTACDDGASGLN